MNLYKYHSTPSELFGAGELSVQCDFDLDDIIAVWVRDGVMQSVELLPPGWCNHVTYDPTVATVTIKWYYLSAGGWTLHNQNGPGSIQFDRSTPNTFTAKWVEHGQHITAVDIEDGVCVWRGVQYGYGDGEYLDLPKEGDRCDITTNPPGAAPLIRACQTYWATQHE